MRSNEKKREGCIEILGQVFCYPQTIWGTLSVACVVGGVILIAYFFVKYHTTIQTPNVKVGYGLSITSTERIEKAGEATENRYQIQFWTPSAKTKLTKGIASWEKIDTDERLNEFAKDLLKDRRVRGYRRYEVTGEGISPRRQGYWWIMAADNDYSPGDFVKAYHEFWKNDTSVYVEVLRSGNSDYHK